MLTIPDCEMVSIRNQTKLLNVENVSNLECGIAFVGFAVFERILGRAVDSLLNVHEQVSILSVRIKRDINAAVQTAQELVDNVNLECLRDNLIHKSSYP